MSTREGVIKFDLAFRAEDGQPVRLRDLITRPTIIAPVYYRCPNVCHFLQGELAQVLPTVKTILVDERDLYMANEIRHSPGQRVVAVVGAAHLPGISARLTAPSPPPERSRGPCPSARR